MRIWDIVELIIGGIIGLIPYILLWKGIKKLIASRRRRKEEEKAAEKPPNKIGFQQAMSGGEEKNLY